MSHSVYCIYEMLLSAYVALLCLGPDIETKTSLDSAFVREKASLAALASCVRGGSAKANCRHVELN